MRQGFDGGGFRTRGIERPAVGTGEGYQHTPALRRQARPHIQPGNSRLFR
ncbi:MAG: hypothetical protein WHX52_21725 [Anaerolineae bacterium]